MSSNRIGGRLIALVGGIAVVVLGAVTAGCNSENQTPSTTTTSTTTSPPSTTPPPPATEKSISPTAGNLFTPGVKAPPAPTVPPGQHPGINGIP